VGIAIVGDQFGLTRDAVQSAQLVSAAQTMAMTNPSFGTLPVIPTGTYL
jgi:hypothetical protein